ncbi:hypothetical protein HUG17_0076 [Dermatophagoides farinae]|uniref:Uncharacterized protein n=1 Tax=Dermatophagoides farinae TaxID=6954 RepID=A0A9D4P5M2_DERFA|nr:hypothetical protein HUG17_0076 [Dermatophagoides farinae]
MAAKNYLKFLLFSTLLCFTQQQHQQQQNQLKIDPFIKRILTTTANGDNSGGSRFDLMIEPHNFNDNQINTNSSLITANISATPISTDSFSHWNPSPIINTKPLTFTRYALFDSFYDQPSSSTNNHSLIRPNDENSINNGDGDLLNSSGSTSNQNFIIPDQIMPYLNAYSTHLNSEIGKSSSPSMANVKPINGNNDDVFIVHHQHHYPPMFMNSESVTGSSSMTSGSMIQPNHHHANVLSPATQTPFRPMKNRHKVNRKKIEKITNRLYQESLNKREHSTSLSSIQKTIIDEEPIDIDLNQQTRNENGGGGGGNNKQQPPTSANLMDLNDRFYYFMMNKMKNFTTSNNNNGGAGDETIMMNTTVAVDDENDNYLMIKSKSKPTTTTTTVEQQHYQSEAIPVSKHHYEIYHNNNNNEKDSLLLNERDNINTNSIYMDTGFGDKDANASTTYQSSLEPLLYHYTPGSNNSWPPEKSLGILPILIQIEDKKSDNEIIDGTSNNNNNNNNGQQQQNSVDYRNNNNMMMMTMQERLYGQPMNIINNQNNDWSQRENGNGVGAVNHNNQWPVINNKQQQQPPQHPARNVIFHNNKPTSLAINPSASNLYPDYHHHHHYNNNNNPNLHTNNNRLRFSPFGPSSYIDDEQNLMNMIGNNGVHPIATTTAANNKFLNPIYPSASDAHLNYYGPIIQATRAPPLLPPTAAAAAATTTTIPLTPSPSIINVNHLLGATNTNPNTNFNYRLLEYWLLRNQLSKTPSSINANINHMNRMKINQDLLAAMQTKLFAPKTTTSSAATTTLPIELEQIYFSQNNYPGYTYGDFMKMPDKYKDAILRSKLLAPLTATATTTSSMINPLDVSTKDLATLASFIWQQQHQQQQQQQTTTGNNKESNKNNKNGNNNNLNNKKRTRSSLKTALAKQFSLSGLTSSNDGGSGTIINTGNNNDKRMIKDDSSSTITTDNNNNNGNGSLMDKRKKSRRNLTKFGLFG